MRSPAAGPLLEGEKTTLTLQGIPEEGMLAIEVHPLSSIMKSLFEEVTATDIVKLVVPPLRKSCIDKSMPRELESVPIAWSPKSSPVEASGAIDMIPGAAGCDHVWSPKKLVANAIHIIRSDFIGRLVFKLLWLLSRSSRR